MEVNVEQLQARLDTMEQRYRRAERRLRAQASLAFLVVIATVLLSPGNRPAFAQSGLTLQLLASRIILLQQMAAVTNKTRFMTADANTHATVFSGCNVVINNGLGATNGLPADPLNTVPTQTRTNGLGNLIVGYNESSTLMGGTDRYGERRNGFGRRLEPP